MLCTRLMILFQHEYHHEQALFLFVWTTPKSKIFKQRHDAINTMYQCSSLLWKYYWSKLYNIVWIPWCNDKHFISSAYSLFFDDIFVIIIVTGGAIQKIEKFWKNTHEMLYFKWKGIVYNNWQRVWYLTDIIERIASILSDNES